MINNLYVYIYVFNQYPSLSANVKILHFYQYTKFLHSHLISTNFLASIHPIFLLLRFSATTLSSLVQSYSVSFIHQFCLPYPFSLSFIVHSDQVPEPSHHQSSSIVVFSLLIRFLTPLTVSLLILFISVKYSVNTRFKRHTMFFMINLIQSNSN